jgi:glycine hydroxymethyltransferase
MIDAEVASVEELAGLVARHEEYRRKCLNMIASENVASPAVRRFLACDLGGRYSTYLGDPSIRTYRGGKVLAQIEDCAQRLAKQAFSAEFADLRPLGGHMAGLAAIFGLTSPGDTVFEMGVMGGHRTASHLTSSLLAHNLIKVEYIPFNIHEHAIDMPRLIDLVGMRKPKLIIFGRDQILFPENIQPIRTYADEVGAYVAYDMSHIHGLIVGKGFPNPLDQGADVILGSHHKSLPGPQGGLYLTRSEEVYERMWRGLFPALVTNHHAERAPALAVAYLEMLQFGEAYVRQIVRNSAALGRALCDLGVQALYAEKGFSLSHQVLVDVMEQGTGEAVADRLERSGILCTPTIVPRDSEGGAATKSGLRLGTQELTRIGMTEEDMSTVARLLARVILGREEGEAVARDVADFTYQFGSLRYCFDENVDPYGAVWATS